MLRSRVSICPRHAKCRCKILPFLTVLFTSNPTWFIVLKLDNCQNYQHSAILVISTWFRRRWKQFSKKFSIISTSLKPNDLGIYGPFYHISVHSGHLHINSQPSWKLAINRQKHYILVVLEAFMKSEKYKICGGTAKKIPRSPKHLLIIHLRLLNFFPVSISLFISKCINSKKHKIIAFLRIFRRILAHFLFPPPRNKYI